MPTSFGSFFHFNEEKPEGHRSSMTNAKQSPFRCSAFLLRQCHFHLLLLFSYPTLNSLPQAGFTDSQTAIE